MAEPPTAETALPAQTTFSGAPIHHSPLCCHRMNGLKTFSGGQLPRWIPGGEHEPHTKTSILGCRQVKTTVIDLARGRYVGRIAHHVISSTGGDPRFNLVTSVGSSKAD